MFSGIIESLGKIISTRKEKGNLILSISCSFASELKPDQSIAHNGACLTVTSVNGKDYSVTAVSETLEKTNLDALKPGDMINLERSVKVGDRLDGHIVQGHVDGTGTCESVEELEGSRKFRFTYKMRDHLTVPKGSVCVNGVSLTVVDSERNKFSVVIIPYTLECTNFKFLKKGDIVNLEFDIVGKYVAAMAKTIN